MSDSFLTPDFILEGLIDNVRSTYEQHEHRLQLYIDLCHYNPDVKERIDNSPLFKEMLTNRRFEDCLLEVKARAFLGRNSFHGSWSTEKPAFAWFRPCFDPETFYVLGCQFDRRYYHAGENVVEDKDPSSYKDKESLSSVCVKRFGSAGWALKHWMRASVLFDPGTTFFTRDSVQITPDFTYHTLN